MRLSHLGNPIGRLPAHPGRSLTGRVLFSVLLLALLVIALSLASPVASPVSLAADEFPRPTGFVNDFAGLLTEAEIQAMTEVIQRLERETGAEIAVVTMRRVEGNTPKGYAVDLFEAWGIGKAGQDNGLLILLALEERQIQVEVGYGLEPILPDGMVGRILDDHVVPHLRAGRWGQGLLAGVEAYAERIRTAAQDPGGLLPEAEPEASENTPFWAWVILALMVGVPVAGVIGVIAAVRRRRCPRCGARMTVTNKILVNPTAFNRGKGLRTYRCRRCGYTREENFIIPAGVAGGAGWVPGAGGWSGSGRSGGFGGGGGFGGFGGGRSGGGGAGRGF